MNLFKRATASVAIVTLVSGLFVTGVSAYSPAELEAANALAAKNIINAKSDAAGYNLDSNVLRQEIAKVATGVAGLAPATSCEDKFGDVSATTPNDWVCGYVETLLANKMVSANPNFRPTDNISKAEAVKLMLETAGHTAIFTDAAKWQEQVVAYAASKGVVASFSDYGTAATRGFVFSVANNAMAEEEVTDEIDLEKLLGLGGDDEDETETTTEGEDTETTTTVSGSSELEVSLSAETPAAATVPGAVNGLPVAKFDFTAGSEDVTVTQITLKRRGLSDKATITSLAIFSEEGRASNGKNDNQENDTEAQLNLSDGGVVVKAGETRTLTVVADLGAAATAAQDEFSLEVVNVVANATVEMDGSVTSNTLRIGSVDAPTITFTKGSGVSNPTLGDTNVDIFEFEIDGSNDEDVVVKSITFEGSSNAEDDLANIKLYLDNKEIASTAAMKDDYLTFDLGEGITIREDKKEDFTVKADIIDGAADTIAFRIDEPLDVTAVSTKFGYGAAVTITGVNVFADGTGDTTEFPLIKIEAGELTITEIEPDFDEVREDKDNVTLGGFKVTNVAGKNLELEGVGIRIELNNGGAAKITGSGANLLVNELFDDVELYNVKTGSSYELTSGAVASSGNVSSAVFSENSVDVILEQGVTEWAIRADTAENIDAFDSATFTLSFTTGQISATTGGFLVKEQEDDTIVTDITPSSISFNTLDGSESGVKASLVNLSDITVVRGAKEIVALQFEVEAEESSYITIDEVIAQVKTNAPAVTAVAQVNTYVPTIVNASAAQTDTITINGTAISFTSDATPTIAEVSTGLMNAINANGTINTAVTATGGTTNVVVTSDAAGTAFTSSVSANIADTATTENVVGLALVPAFSSTNLPSQTITEVKLYKGSVSEANLLDQESGSNLANDGTASFNDFDDIKIEANATETFVVTVSIVDGQNAVDNRIIATDLVSLSAEDDDNDDVTVAGLTTPLTSARDLSIKGFGVLTLTNDANNEDNEDNKTILAGDDVTIFSVDVQATNESMDVEEVVFTLDTDLTQVITNASLYLNDTLIDTNNISDVTATTITFEDLSTLIVKEENAELKLRLNTETIGYQKVGSTTTGINVTNVELKKVEGVDSGKDAANASSAVTSKDASIVPGVVTPSVQTSLNSSTTPELKLTATFGDNSKDVDNSVSNVEVTELKFSTLGTTGTLAYTLTNVDDSGNSVAGSISGNVVTFDVSTLAANNKTISNGVAETFKVTITGSVEGNTAKLTLLEDGVTYSVVGNANSTGLTTNLTQELDLGSRSY